MAMVLELNILDLLGSVSTGHSCAGDEWHLVCAGHFSTWKRYININGVPAVQYRQNAWRLYVHLPYFLILERLIIHIVFLS